MIRPDFDHVGIVVPDVGAAMKVLSSTFNLEWLPAVGTGADLQMQGPGRDIGPVRIVAATTTGYPRIELVQAVPDTPWALEGSAFKRLLIGQCPIVIEGVGKDGTVPKTFTYQLLENGLIFELLEETFLEDGQRQVDMGCILNF
jgi:hypothetical protein